MSTEGSGASRGGGDEFHNEDAFVAEEELGLYAVSDGASELPAGEVAASIATGALERFMAQARVDPLKGDRLNEEFVQQGMAESLQAVREASEAQPGRGGMVASVTMLLTDGRRGVIGHRGDSRAYLIRRRRAVQLTVDQELTDDASVGGTDPDVSVFALDLRAGDTLVLCTDGAEQVVEDPDIVRVAGEISPHVLASRIVSTANRRSPNLDATAVAVRVRAERDRAWLESSGEGHENAFAHVRTPTAAARRKAKD